MAQHLRAFVRRGVNRLFTRLGGIPPNDVRHVAFPPYAVGQVARRHPALQRCLALPHAHPDPRALNLQYLRHRAAVIMKQHVAALVRLGVERHGIALLHRRADGNARLRQGVVNVHHLALRGHLHHQRIHRPFPPVHEERIIHIDVIIRLARQRLVKQIAAIPAHFLIQHPRIRVNLGNVPFFPLLGHPFAQFPHGLVPREFARQRQNPPERSPSSRPDRPRHGDKAVFAPDRRPLAVIAHELHAARRRDGINHPGLLVAGFINQHILVKCGHFGVLLHLAHRLRAVFQPFLPNIALQRFARHPHAHMRPAVRKVEHLQRRALKIAHQRFAPPVRRFMQHDRAVFLLRRADRRANSRRIEAGGQRHRRKHHHHKQNRAPYCFHREIPPFY